MSASLPSGTVTFLFTDVEGSTRLLEELGAERYASELGRHRDVVRSSLAEHGGVEVDTQGDAFFCAFASARDAVACAAEIQSALADGPISVRMGVHTGEALVVDRHYVGLDVHRAARIGACGHGGQVVISPSTAGLFGADELSLRDLGAHRLKDLSAPVTLYQLGDGQFPPLRTLFRTNLPVPATPFLGRDAELRDLIERASQPGLRLLTLTGPGGTGKTRLALQLAAELSGEYPDGAWWVPLAALRDGSLVASALASALVIEEETGQPLTSSIAHAIERRRLLLLLDNCEHLVEEAAALVAEIASRCPDVFVLATSREALAIAGEHVYDVQSLSSGDAVALFFARAGAAGASIGSEAVGDVTLLCERLDNLPLAVELAAARAPALPPATLLARLGSGLDVLKGPRDVEERQRTLRATIAWSYGLLDEREQRLFRRLSVFVGGAVLSAVEEVCDAELDDLVSVVAKSLVRQTHADGDEPRYWMLETIREFAAQELEAAGERDVLRDRHVGWYATLARAARADEALAAGEHVAGLDHDLANLRAAFSRSLILPARTIETSAISAALLVQHLQQGRYAEAEDVARRTLDLELAPLQASLLHGVLGFVLRVVGRPREALESYRAAETLLDGMPARDQPWWERWISLKLDQAHFFYMENDPSALERVVEELEPAVALHGTAAQRLDLLHVRQQHRYRRERYVFSEETEGLAREIYALDREAGAVGADFILGFSLLWRGKLDEAEAHFERGMNIATAKGAALIATRCLVYSLLARRKRNDVEGARARLVEIATLEELHGYVGLVRANSAWIAYRDGDLELAARHGEEALADWRSEGRTGHGVFEWTARFPLLGVAVASGDLDSAGAHARAMLDASQQPLPQELADALEDGLRDGFARALEIARPSGYA